MNHWMWTLYTRCRSAPQAYLLSTRAISQKQRLSRLQSMATKAERSSPKSLP
jgi:hypothetical protein